MFSIASTTFDDVDSDEKKIYMGKSPEVYEGYKPRQTWVSWLTLATRVHKPIWFFKQQIEQGVTDQIEHYNSMSCLHNTLK